MVTGDARGMDGLHSVPLLVDGVLADMTIGGAKVVWNETDILSRAAQSLRAEEGEDYVRTGAFVLIWEDCALSGQLLIYDWHASCSCFPSVSVIRISLISSPSMFCLFHLSTGFQSNSPGNSMEFSLDDFCVAQLATRVGDEAVAADFNATAQYWQKVWNPTRQFMCPLQSNGSWGECDSKSWPLLALNVFDSHYTEVSAAFQCLFADIFGDYTNLIS